MDIPTHEAQEKSLNAMLNELIRLRDQHDSHEMRSIYNVAWSKIDATLRDLKQHWRAVRDGLAR